jgi:hypothetical protein
LPNPGESDKAGEGMGARWDEEAIAHLQGPRRVHARRLSLLDLASQPGRLRFDRGENLPWLSGRDFLFEFAHACAQGDLASALR